MCIADNEPISQDALNELMQAAPPGWEPSDYELLSQTAITKLTGIEKGNLSRNIAELIARGILKRQGSRKSRCAGRPAKYLILVSPYTILDLCDELEYRMSGYERERGDLQDFIDKQTRDWLRSDDQWDVADGFTMTGIEENREAKTKLQKLYRFAASNSLREVSYPMVQYWLWRLRQKVEKVPKQEIRCHGQMNVTQYD